MTLKLRCWGCLHCTAKSSSTQISGDAVVHIDMCSQITALVKAGFRVVAPDLRGALGGESDSPKEVEAYDIPKCIVKDVAGAKRCILKPNPSLH